MNIKNNQKGFTLIELLVVIAIIGLLAAIVLASLNTARSKGANAAVKANLANARTQAEVYYDSTATGHYGVLAASDVSAAGAASGVCALDATVFDSTPNGAGTVSINPNIVAAENAGTGTGTPTTKCVAISNGTNVTAWAALTPLKVAEGTFNFWCVDSSGSSKGTVNAAVINSTDAVC